MWSKRMTETKYVTNTNETLKYIWKYNIKKKQKMISIHTANDMVVRKGIRSVVIIKYIYIYNISYTHVTNEKSIIYSPLKG